MKYQVGDKIIVLHSDEEGKVIDIINDDMVMIEVRGVKFPAYMDQIDFPYFKMFSQKKAPVEKKKIFVDQIRTEKKPSKKKIRDGVDINFIPVFDKDVFDDDVVEKMKIILVNHNEEGYDFEYNLNFGGESHFELKNSIRGLSDFYLHDVSFEDMNDGPKFDFLFSLTVPDKKKAPYFEASLKLKAKQLFKKIEDTLQKNEASFPMPLFEKYPDKLVEEKFDLTRLGNSGFRFYEASRARQFMPAAQSVVDLHIEKLTDNHRHMSNFDILTLQLNTFEKYYELAVNQHLPSMIVIHGVGEGILRDEIHAKLRVKDEVKSFVNQYHPMYGWGATEIFFDN